MKLVLKNFYVKIFSLFLLVAIATIFTFVLSKDTGYFIFGIKNLYIVIVLYGGVIPFLTIERKLIEQTKFGITRKNVFFNNTFAYLTISSFFIIYELIIFIMQYAFDYIYTIDITLLINVALSFFVIATYGEIIGLNHLNKFIKIAMIFILAIILVLLYYFLQNYIINILLGIVSVLLFFLSLKTYRKYIVRE